MKVELINKEFKLKETQYMIEHDSFPKTVLSKHRYLGREGQKVILIDIHDDLAAVRNEGESITYYTLFSNLE